MLGTQDQHSVLPGVLGGLHAGDELEQPRHILRLSWTCSFCLLSCYIAIISCLLSSLRGQDDFSGHAGTRHTAGTQCVLSRSHSFPLERGITGLPAVTSPSPHLEVPAYEWTAFTECTKVWEGQTTHLVSANNNNLTALLKGAWGWGEGALCYGQSWALPRVRGLGSMPASSHPGFLSLRFLILSDLLSHLIGH